MHPEYLLIPIDLPDKIQRVTHTDRESVSMVSVGENVLLVDPQCAVVKIAKALEGHNWLLAPRHEKQGMYLQNILLHCLKNPGQLGAVGMFVEHCKSAGVFGTATQILISSQEVIYLLVIDHTGKYELRRFEDDTLYQHGAMLTQQEIVDQFNADNQRRIDRVAGVFDAFGTDGFIMPSAES